MDMLVDSDDLLADAGLIADALVIPSPGSKDPHWDDSARNLIEGLVLHVATSGEFVGQRHLVKVFELLADVLKPASSSTPDKPVYQPGAGHAGQPGGQRGGAVRRRDFYERAGRERDSVLSTARRHLHFLGYPKIQETLRRSSFDLRDLKRKRVSVYLSLPAMRMGSCSRWLRLFVNLTLAAMEHERKAPAHPVLMMLDEFAVLGTMKQIEDAAGQIAGLGVKLWVVLQDLGQLKALYAERWKPSWGTRVFCSSLAIPSWPP